MPDTKGYKQQIVQVLSKEAEKRLEKAEEHRQKAKTLQQQGEAYAALADELDTTDFSPAAIIALQQELS